MKKLITVALTVALTGALTGALLLSTQVIGFADINIEVNGKSVPFDANNGLGVPFVDENNRTLVPFRIAMEFAGATVDWNNDTRTAIAMKDGIKVEAPIGKNYIYKDGVKEIIDTQAVIKDGRTYLPIRAVLEALEYKISWEQETQTVVAESEGYVEEVVKLGETLEELTLTESDATIEDFDGQSNKVEFSISITVVKSLDKQYEEVEAYLNTKVGVSLTKEIMDYVKSKDSAKIELPEKYWNWGDKRIQVLSSKSSSRIAIRAW